MSFIQNLHGLIRFYLTRLQCKVKTTKEINAAIKELQEELKTLGWGRYDKKMPKKELAEFLHDLESAYDWFESFLGTNEMSERLRAALVKINQLTTGMKI